MPRKPPSLIRSQAVRVRIREDEAKAFRSLCAKLERTPSEVLRRLLREAVTGGPEYFSDGLAELKRCRLEMAAIGRNVNQLAKHANRGDGVVPSQLREELKATHDALERLRSLYNDAIRRVSKRSIRKWPKRSSS